MNTISNHTIEPQSGKAFSLKANQLVKIIDPGGYQTGDFFAVVSADHAEYFSSAVTIDSNSNIYLKEKDFLYSNKYNQLLQIEQDTVGGHDLLHPTCSQRMYETAYGINQPHPSCHQNFQDSLKEFGIAYRNLTNVFNFFMNVKVNEDGKLIYTKTPPEAGRFIILRACVDLIVAVTSCSVTQSAINNFTAGPLIVEILGSTD